MTSKHAIKFSIGAKIKALRLAQKLTQEELALKANITPNYVSLVETDVREASIDVYRCIADALHIPMWQIFCNLSDESLLILEDFDDCSETEIHMLRRFINGVKHAIRHKQSI